MGRFIPHFILLPILCCQYSSVRWSNFFTIIVFHLPFIQLFLFWLPMSMYHPLLKGSTLSSTFDFLFDQFSFSKLHFYSFLNFLSWPSSFINWAFKSYWIYLWVILSITRVHEPPLNFTTLLSSWSSNLWIIEFPQLWN